MNLTDEEIESMYLEFKRRMTNEKLGYASCYKTLHNMEPAKDYFWSRYHQMTNDYGFDNWSTRGIISRDWDLVRRLVCHAYGVTIVKEIPEEELVEANNLAIEIINSLFTVNSKILKNKKD